jgi:hypothetical protein
MEIEIIKNVSERVKSEIEPDNWLFHVSVVRERCLELGKLLDADLEILELSALLHDVGRSRFGGEDHEISGAANAVELLSELGYPEERIGMVEGCILKHRGQEDNLPETLEEKILANADAMSHFDQAFYLVYLRAKKIGLKEAIEKTVRGLEERWDGKLNIPEARAMIEEKREAVMSLLRHNL